MARALKASIGLLPKGLGMAMTDVFISATAALLLAIAIARPEPPQPKPIQADFVALCPLAEAGPTQRTLTLFAVLDGAPAAPMVSIGHAGHLLTAPMALGLPPRPHYAVALAGGPGRPLDAACFNWAEIEVFRSHNTLLAENPPEQPLRPIFALTPIAQRLSPPTPSASEEGRP